MRENKRKLVLTGGHAGATAYALIEEINKLHKEDLQVHWIGSRNAFEGKSHPTFESEILPKAGVVFHSLFSGRLQTRFSIWTIPSLLKIPIGLIHAFVLIIKINPEVVVSFGGFSAVPVVVVSWLLGKPVIVHEQTIAYGRANKFSSFFATKIAISRQESSDFFPKHKCVLTGNPVSLEIAGIKPKLKMGNPPNVFITGGSRGSVAINDVVEKSLDRLLLKYIIIHQAGSMQIDKFQKLKVKLPSNLKSKYKVYSLLPPQQWRATMALADVVVSRSGANIVSEILLAKRPSIFIPLPIAFMDEQKKNALFVKRLGLAQIIEQNDLNPETLLKALEITINSWKSIQDKVKGFESPDRNASKKLSELIYSYLK